MDKKNNFIFILYFLISSTFFSQNNKGIHQIEYENYLKKSVLINENKISSSVIKPISLKKKNELSKTVFGYYPYWEYSKNAHLNFDYNLLTHIAMFDFGVSSNGAISTPSGWPWTDFMNEAHSNGVKLIMVIVNFNKTEIHNIITNATARWIFVNGVKAKIKQYNLDGVNIDFERLETADRGVRINNFMQELSDTVHNISSELEVSFATPAVNWGGYWNFEGLASSCDYLFIMGYAFYGKWSTTTGPTAPLTGGTYNITNTINVQYGSVVNNTPEKIILGVPYYGPHWETESDLEGSKILYDIVNGEKKYRHSNMYFRDAEGESQSHGLKWSSKYNNSWYSYLSGFTNHQVWFDNDSSLSLKYDLAISKNLKGIGMWALGYDGTRKELWDLIERKFVEPVAVQVEKISNEIMLHQNYPNPFNPTTTIKYTIPNLTHPLIHSRDGKERSDRSVLQNSLPTFGVVTLKVYDVLGQEIATLVNSEKSPGYYQVTFNSEKLPSGTYFYQLKVDNFIQTKKMILLR